MLAGTDLVDDDVTLVAKSKSHIARIIHELQQAALQSGLELHPDKTRNLTNATKSRGRGSGPSIAVGDMKICILPVGESAQYLGTQVCFQEH